MATQIQAAELLAGQRLENHFKVVQDMKKIMPEVASAGLRVRTALEKGRKILICGNGGSAADSQHMAAEFVGRFVKATISTGVGTYSRYVPLDSRR